MTVFQKLCKNKGTVLALGFFDGVHLAHQKLIKKAVETAKENNLKSAVLTFKESPYSVLTGAEPNCLIPLDDKIKLIEKLGAEDIYVLDFNEFKNIEAEDYIKILIDFFAPEFIVTGFNHTFGSGKKGNSALLASHKKDFKYIEIKPVKIGQALVSSTNIKAALQSGDLALANKMLDRNFSYGGKVVEGQKIAGGLGYKTANIIRKRGIIKLPYGVYFGAAKYKNALYRALINFGNRPSVDKNLTETLEVHLVDFEGNLYGERLDVEFLHYFRNEIKFNSINDLKNRINLDYAEFCAYFKA